MKKIALFLVTLTAFATTANAGQVNTKDLECLAKNIYHEARGESELGQQAVAHVVLNRVNSRRYPNTVCDVVYQVTIHNKTKRKTPQFTWTLDGRSDKIRNMEVYKAILSLATLVLQRRVKTSIGKSVLYHTSAIAPKWSRSKKIKKAAEIGSHIFYAYNS